MVKSLIASTIILIFVFISISCQQGVSPLASQAIGTKQQTELASADSTAQTGSNAATVDGEPSDLLQARIRPNKWNLDWEKSQGFVTVKFMGDGITEINTETLRLVGPEHAATNAPLRTHLGQFALTVKFFMREAIAIVPDPKRGDSCEIGIMGQYMDGSQLEALTDMVFIVGRKHTKQKLSMVIRPKNWNLAWLKKDDADMVAALIKGKGFDDILPGSIVMQGLAGGPSITPAKTELKNNGLIVKFWQNQAVGLIPDPQSHEKYPIFVIVSLSGGDTFNLRDIISIKGKKNKKK